VISKGKAVALFVLLISPLFVMATRQTQNVAQYETSQLDQALETEYYLSFGFSISSVGGGVGPLLSILWYWDYSVDHFPIVNYLANITGTYNEGLEMFARDKAGFATFAGPGNVSYVKQCIRTGFPVIVHNSPSRYRVIQGYDLTTFLLLDGYETGTTVISITDFITTWENNWTLLIIPHDQKVLDEKYELQEWVNLERLRSNAPYVEPFARMEILEMYLDTTARWGPLFYIRLNWTGTIEMSPGRMRFSIGEKSGVLGTRRVIPGSNTVKTGLSENFNRSEQITLTFYSGRNTPLRSATAPTAEIILVKWGGSSPPWYH